jgi:hypothetical protein
VASIEFTAPAVSSTATPGEYTCSHSIAGGNNTLEISAKVLPNRATEKTINWTASGVASLDLNTGNNVTVTFSGTGEPVITASSGDKTIKLTITVTTESIPVSSITISAAGSKTSIMAGNGSTAQPETMQFSAVVNPDSASDPSVTWVISDTSVSDGGNTSGCTISTDGLLTAPASLASDLTIYVFAQANDGSGVVSNGTVITVKQYVAPLWEWKAGDTWNNSGTLTNINGKTQYRGGGQIPLASGNIDLQSGGRFTVGAKANSPNTANNNSGPEGEFDFTKRFSVTVWYQSVSASGGSFFVYLQNNGTSGGNSVFNNNAIIQVLGTSIPAGPNSLTVTIDPANLTLTTQAVTANIDKNAVLAKAFLQFRAESGTTLVITRMLVRYE